MKKIIFSLIKIVLCTSLFIFSSCSDFWRPSKYIYLDDRFYYLKEYAEIDFSGYPGDGIWYRATPMIMPKIEEYYFNDNYITIKQKYHKKNSSSLLERLLYFDHFGKINTNVFSVYDSTMQAVKERMTTVKLRVNEVKSKIVYCKDSNRRGGT